MTELSKTSIFEKITAIDYYSKKNGHANLPKINLSTQETGREVNMIEAKITRSGQAKKTATAAINTTPKKSSTTGKAIILADKKVTPCFQKRMKFNLRVTPQAKMDKDLNGSYKPTDSDNFLSDVNCTYEIKDRNGDKAEKSTFLELTKQNGCSRRKELDEYGSKNGPNIALNLNLALNMDSKDKDKPSESEIGSNFGDIVNTDSDTNFEKSLAMDTPSSITVAVRLRPLSESEKTLQGEAIKDILIKDNRVLIPHKKDCFEFDYCLNSSNNELFQYASQEVVYRKMGEPLLNQAFKGYNTCLFAYGQSGSGKTYTMMGSENVPGIIPRFIRDLFSRISSSRDTEFIVNISFMEIYNEKIYDLLTDDFEMFNKNLRVREHPQTGPYVEDLTVYTVENYENAMELLQSGITRRSTANTHLNEQSSRSHSIFSILLVQNKKLELSDSNSEMSCMSKIHLIDLAGSEKANLFNNDRFREGTSINKSLLTLGKVISQLADHSVTAKTEHIPYRESVLTFLLKDSLGGNSRTSMIATISPAKVHLDETISTLRYASTAQKIVNIVHVNEDPKMKVINSLLKQISFLKKEVDKNKTESFDQSSDSEKESESKCSIMCSEQIKVGMEKLNEQFKTLLDSQKTLLDSFEQLKEETNKPKQYEIEIPSFSTKVVEELKSILMSVKDENLLKDSINYDAIMKEMESNEELEEEPKQSEKENDELEQKGKKGGKGKNNKQQQKKDNDKSTTTTVAPVSDETDLKKGKEEESQKEVKGAKGKLDKKQSKKDAEVDDDDEKTEIIQQEDEEEEKPKETKKESKDGDKKDNETEGKGEEAYKDETVEEEEDAWQSSKSNKKSRKELRKEAKEAKKADKNKKNKGQNGDDEEESLKTSESKKPDPDESINDEFEDAQDKLPGLDAKEESDDKPTGKGKSKKAGQVEEPSTSDSAKKDNNKDDNDDWEDNKKGNKKAKKGGKNKGKGKK